LIAELAREPDVIIGHSFGGKVALMFAALFPGRARQLWMLDSNPKAQTPGNDHEILRMLEALRHTHTPASERASVVKELMAQGLSSGVAHWLETNLVRDAQGFVWRFDLAALQALMLDYFQVDLWPLLKAPPIHSELHLVVAEQSDRFDTETRAQLQAIATAGALRLHTVPNAGHWLHVDNPTFVTELLATGLANAQFSAAHG
jgi:pimeloyl-ACP methyl ester carboxylesterase